MFCCPAAGGYASPPCTKVFDAVFACHSSHEYGFLIFIFVPGTSKSIRRAPCPSSAPRSRSASAAGSKVASSRKAASRHCSRLRSATAKLPGTTGRASFAPCSAFSTCYRSAARAPTRREWPRLRPRRSGRPSRNRRRRSWPWPRRCRCSRRQVGAREYTIINPPVGHATIVWIVCVIFLLSISLAGGAKAGDSGAGAGTGRRGAGLAISGGCGRQDGCYHRACWRCSGHNTAGECLRERMRRVSLPPRVRANDGDWFLRYPLNMRRICIPGRAGINN